MDGTTRKTLHPHRFPGESVDYRAARDRLLEEEVALRRHTEKVAQMRRALPAGGVAKDYVFEGVAGPIKLSELFGPHDSLITYHYMFGPERKAPCPMCTGIVGALASNAADIEQRAALVVIGASPVARLEAFARERGWRHLRFVSDAGTSFARDYFATIDGSEVPMFNVFRRDASDDGNGAIRHFWASEMSMVPSDPGQDERTGDMLFPLWNALDLTPAGRGTGWYPKLSYPAGR